MTQEEKAKGIFSPLRDVDISPKDKMDILHNLRNEMVSKKPRRKLNMGVFPGVGAAVAAVAIVVGGVGYLTQSHQWRPSHTVNVTSALNPTVSGKDILKLLPKGSQLIPSDVSGSLIQQVDLNNDGKHEYAALYQYPNQGAKLIGAIVVATNNNGTIKKLWQYNGKIGLVKPTSLTIKNVQNDGKKDIIFKAEEGAMANYYDVLTWENGGVKSIFQTSAYRMDIGRYGKTNANQIVTWTSDTGFLYNIQVNEWNSKDKQFETVPNSTASRYFKDTMIPYYQNVSKSNQGKQGAKGVAFGLAQAYLGAGEYQSALSEVSKGLKLNPNDYPPNSEFMTLKNQILQASKGGK